MSAVRNRQSARLRLDPETAESWKDETPKKTAGAFAPAIAPPGLEPTAAEGNQDSPDPEGPQEPPKLQQLATLYASSCHPMLELPASMLDFALLYSHKC